MEDTSAYQKERVESDALMLTFNKFGTCSGAINNQTVHENKSPARKSGGIAPSTR